MLFSLFDYFRNLQFDARLKTDRFNNHPRMIDVGHRNYVGLIYDRKSRLLLLRYYIAVNTAAARVFITADLARYH